MAITSQVQSTIYPDNLRIQDWQEASLLKPSIIKPIITTVQSNLTLKKLGSLSSKDREQLRILTEEIIGR